MSAFDVPASAARNESVMRRARLVRSAILFILGPTILYALYLLLIAPAQFHSQSSFAVRGAQASQTDALAALAIVAPTSNTADSRVIENYIRSDAMVAALRQRYGFNEAYDKFSLDPTARISPKASLPSATQFWRHKVEVVSDPITSGAMVRVSAYTPEDTLRLSRGVLALSEELVNSLPNRAMTELIGTAEREVALKRAAYDQSRETLAQYQGRQYSGVQAGAPAQQALSLVGQLESQLAQKRAELATARQTFQPGAPQLTGVEGEIAALESERDQAVARAMTAPGEQAAQGDIQAQSLLLDYQTSQQAYQQAVLAEERARRQLITDRKYIISYIPPQRPEGSDWWSRLVNVLAVLIGFTLLWAIGSLIYSIIRDHVE